MVRAKFTCTQKNQGMDGYELVFAPVTWGSEENDSFYKYTPWGELKMGTINPDAAAQFVPGKQYYLDFSPAER